MLIAFIRFKYLPVDALFYSNGKTYKKVVGHYANSKEFGANVERYINIQEDKYVATNYENVEHDESVKSNLTSVSIKKYNIDIGCLPSVRKYFAFIGKNMEDAFKVN